VVLCESRELRAQYQKVQEALIREFGRARLVAETRSRGNSTERSRCTARTNDRQPFADSMAVVETRTQAFKGARKSSGDSSHYLRGCLTKRL
jgi:hypothetical protein